jgi:uncharacterized coiled-coil protein SlyX
MAVDTSYEPVTRFEQWYVDYDPTGGRDGGLEFRGMAPCADHVWHQWQFFKREMDLRVENYEILEKLADAEVISPKPDLPNVSSGETAGLVRRIARNLVQNCPNVEVISKFDDDSVHGIFSRHILTAKIIGSDQYSNDMQQNLFASTKTALTLGFTCVIPLLLQDAAGGWYIKYDTIHYRDVFPENGCKDVRTATSVYVRRYLTKGEVKCLIRDEAPGWDIAALKHMMKNSPYGRARESVDHQTKKRGQIPEGYEIITWYSSSGDPFLTFSASTKYLLRIEKNKHPLKQHPVHFLVLEKDDQQPLGKSQVELLVGRQDFQDLMLNGAMKLWYRNINPSIIGYGTVNSIPNLSPGKYTQIANPNAKVEPFEVNTQTLMQYGQISQQNLASMVSMIGSADQQMAMQGGANGQGMSATPQGVDAQQQMVDITTNNYQKSIEAFFSHYCSYALTIYFQELRTVKKVAPTADARIKLLEAGLPVDAIADDGTMTLDFEDMACEYWVRCVPGSLVELEDEKQLRILNQMFIPLSQAMPAMAATQDQKMLMQAAKAMQYIIGKQIELSGATSAKEIGLIWKTGDVEEVASRDQRIAALEESIGNYDMLADLELDEHNAAIVQLQQQMHMMAENQQILLEKLGVMGNGSAPGSATAPGTSPPAPAAAPPAPSLLPASA